MILADKGEPRVCDSTSAQLSAAQQNIDLISQNNNPSALPLRPLHAGCLPDAPIAACVLPGGIKFILASGTVCKLAPEGSQNRFEPLSSISASRFSPIAAACIFCAPEDRAKEAVLIARYSMNIAMSPTHGAPRCEVSLVANGKSLVTADLQTTGVTKVSACADVVLVHTDAGGILFLKLSEGPQHISISSRYGTARQFATHLVSLQNPSIDTPLFRSACRLISINTAGPPITMHHRHNHYLLYQNGAFICYYGLWLQFVSIIQPISAGEASIDFRADLRRPLRLPMPTVEEKQRRGSHLITSSSSVSSGSNSPPTPITSAALFANYLLLVGYKSSRVEMYPVASLAASRMQVAASSILFDQGPVTAILPVLVKIAPCDDSTLHCGSILGAVVAVQGSTLLYVLKVFPEISVISSFERPLSPNESVGSPFFVKDILPLSGEAYRNAVYIQVSNCDVLEATLSHDTCVRYAGANYFPYDEMLTDIPRDIALTGGIHDSPDNKEEGALTTSFAQGLVSGTNNIADSLGALQDTKDHADNAASESTTARIDARIKQLTAPVTKTITIDNKTYTATTSELESAPERSLFSNIPNQSEVVYDRNMKRYYAVQDLLQYYNSDHARHNDPLQHLQARKVSLANGKERPARVGPSHRNRRSIDFAPYVFYSQAPKPKHQGRHNRDTSFRKSFPTGRLPSQPIMIKSDAFFPPRRYFHEVRAASSMARTLPAEKVQLDVNSPLSEAQRQTVDSNSPTPVFPQEVASLRSDSKAHSIAAVQRSLWAKSVFRSAATSDGDLILADLQGNYVPKQLPRGGFVYPHVLRQEAPRVRSELIYHNIVIGAPFFKFITNSVSGIAGTAIVRFTDGMIIKSRPVLSRLNMDILSSEVSHVPQNVASSAAVSNALNHLPYEDALRYAMPHAFLPRKAPLLVDPWLPSAHGASLRQPSRLAATHADEGALHNMFRNTADFPSNLATSALDAQHIPGSRQSMPPVFSNRRHMGGLSSNMYADDTTPISYLQQSFSDNSLQASMATAEEQHIASFIPDYNFLLVSGAAIDPPQYTSFASPRPHVALYSSAAATDEEMVYLNGRYVPIKAFKKQDAVNSVHTLLHSFASHVSTSLTSHPEALPVAEGPKPVSKPIMNIRFKVGNKYHVISARNLGEYDAASALVDTPYIRRPLDKVLKTTDALFGDIGQVDYSRLNNAFNSKYAAAHLTARGGKLLDYRRLLGDMHGDKFAEFGAERHQDDDNQQTNNLQSHQPSSAAAIAEQMIPQHISTDVPSISFTHNDDGSQRERYDLLSLCTYRGPLPQLDNETMDLYCALEQRSNYHLGFRDPGPGSFRVQLDEGMEVVGLDKIADENKQKLSRACIDELRKAAIMLPDVYVLRRKKKPLYFSPQLVAALSTFHPTSLLSVSSDGRKVCVLNERGSVSALPFEEPTTSDYGGQLGKVFEPMHLVPSYYGEHNNASSVLDDAASEPCAMVSTPLDLSQYSNSLQRNFSTSFIEHPHHLQRQQVAGPFSDSRHLKRRNSMSKAIYRTALLPFERTSKTLLELYDAGSSLVEKIPILQPVTSSVTSNGGEDTSLDSSSVPIITETIQDKVDSNFHALESSHLSAVLSFDTVSTEDTSAVELTDSIEPIVDNPAVTIPDAATQSSDNMAVSASVAPQQLERKEDVQSIERIVRMQESLVQHSTTDRVIKGEVEASLEPYSRNEPYVIHRKRLGSTDENGYIYLGDLREALYANSYADVCYSDESVSATELPPDFYFHSLGLRKALAAKPRGKRLKASKRTSKQPVHSDVQSEDSQQDSSVGGPFFFEPLSHGVIETICPNNLSILEQSASSQYHSGDIATEVSRGSCIYAFDYDEEMHIRRNENEVLNVYTMRKRLANMMRESSSDTRLANDDQSRWEWIVDQAGALIRRYDVMDFRRSGDLEVILEEYSSNENSKLSEPSANDDIPELSGAELLRWLLAEPFVDGSCYHSADDISIFPGCRKRLDDDLTSYTRYVFERAAPKPKKRGAASIDMAKRPVRLTQIRRLQDVQDAHCYTENVADLVRITFAGAYTKKSSYYNSSITGYFGRFFHPTGDSVKAYISDCACLTKQRAKSAPSHFAVRSLIGSSIIGQQISVGVNSNIKTRALRSHIVSSPPQCLAGLDRLTAVCTPSSALSNSDRFSPKVLSLLLPSRVTSAIDVFSSEFKRLQAKYLRHNGRSQEIDMPLDQFVRAFRQALSQKSLSTKLASAELSEATHFSPTQDSLFGELFHTERNETRADIAELDSLRPNLPYDVQFDWLIRPGSAYVFGGTFLEVPFKPPRAFETLYPLDTDAGDAHFDLPFLCDLYPVLETNFNNVVLCQRTRNINIHADELDLALLANKLFNSQVNKAPGRAGAQSTDQAPDETSGDNTDFGIALTLHSTVESTPNRTSLLNAPLSHQNQRENKLVSQRRSRSRGFLETPYGNEFSKSGVLYSSDDRPVNLLRTSAVTSQLEPFSIGSTSDDYLQSIPAASQERRPVRRSKKPLALLDLPPIGDPDLLRSVSIDQDMGPQRALFLSPQQRISLAPKRSRKVGSKKNAIGAVVVQQNTDIGLPPSATSSRAFDSFYAPTSSQALDLVYSVSTKYYTQLCMKSQYREQPFRLGLVPLRALLQNVLFDALVSLPKEARYIAKRLAKDGQIFREEELQFLPYTYIQTHLLHRPAKDLAIFLRDRMSDFFANEALLERLSRDETASPAMQALMGTIMAKRAPQTKPFAFDGYLYKPLHNLLNFGDYNANDKNQANKALFNACTSVVYRTRLIVGRTNQLLMWKMRVLSRRNKPVYPSSDPYAGILVRFNNLATSISASQTMNAMMAFSTSQECTIARFISATDSVHATFAPTMLCRDNGNVICVLGDTKIDWAAVPTNKDVCDGLVRSANVHPYLVLHALRLCSLPQVSLGISPHAYIHLLSWSNLLYVYRARRLISAQSRDSEIQDQLCICFYSFVKFLSIYGKIRLTFLPNVMARVFKDIEYGHIIEVLKAVTLYELRLRMGNNYVLMWPHIDRLLGSSSGFLLGQWLDTTFKAIYLINSGAGNACACSDSDQGMQRFTPIENYEAIKTLVAADPLKGDGASDYLYSTRVPSSSSILLTRPQSLLSSASEPAHIDTNQPLVTHRAPTITLSGLLSKEDQTEHTCRENDISGTLQPHISPSDSLPARTLGPTLSIDSSPRSRFAHRFRSDACKSSEEGPGSSVLNLAMQQTIRTLNSPLRGANVRADQNGMIHLDNKVLRVDQLKSLDYKEELYRNMLTAGDYEAILQDLDRRVDDIRRGHVLGEETVGGMPDEEDEKNHNQETELGKTIFDLGMATQITTKLRLIDSIIQKNEFRSNPESSPRQKKPHTEDHISFSLSDRSQFLHSNHQGERLNEMIHRCAAMSAADVYTDSTRKPPHKDSESTDEFLRVRPSERLLEFTADHPNKHTENMRVRRIDLLPSSALGRLSISSSDYAALAKPLSHNNDASTDLNTREGPVSLPDAFDHIENDGELLQQEMERQEQEHAVLKYKVNKNMIDVKYSLSNKHTWQTVADAQLASEKGELIKLASRRNDKAGRTMKELAYAQKAQRPLLIPQFTMNLRSDGNKKRQLMDRLAPVLPAESMLSAGVQYAVSRVLSPRRKTRVQTIPVNVRAYCEPEVLSPLQSRGVPEIGVRVPSRILPPINHNSEESAD